ncbi:MAG TPA: DUF748 domain-containing protein [Cyclobacteriaceae bacterium]|nr:DUF748 domain-containing protein [Cyclobacteriaceae bacterium]
MKIFKVRIKKGYSYTALAILFAWIVVMIVVSPLAKYYMEKYDVDLFGREATIGWAYVNPITGYVHFHDVEIYELQGDSIFISATGASANFSMTKLLSKQVWIEQLTVDHPWVRIVQKKDTLSFDDVIDRFSGDGSDSTHSNAWHVTLLDTEIIAGEFHYYEQIIPINYFIKNLNLVGPGKTQDVDTISAKFSFEDGKGKGRMQGDFTINQKTLDYRFGAEVQTFDLEIIRQYIWELINYGMFHSTLDAKIKATGNFKSADSIRASGRLFLSDFHLGKTNEDAYIAFKKLALVIDDLSPARNKFLFDSITLHAPYIKYEVFDSLDNVQALFGKEGKNISDVTSQPGRFNLVIEIARYLREISRNFFVSDFQIGTLGIFDGNVAFNDYSTSEKFSISASPLTIRADSVNKRNKRVSFSLTSDIKPYGYATFLMSINPRDSGDFDLKYNVEKIPATAFNPYLISITSFPLDRGTLELNGLWNVRNSIINSNNHVLIIDPRITKRVRNKDSKWIPMPLIMSLTRDRGNVMDYQVPITGDLKHPKFHLKDVITDVVKNIFVKPVTIPYQMEIKELEMEIEKSMTLKWEMSQPALVGHQRRFVKDISGFLKGHPDASLVVHPIQYEAKEKEHILFYETKKKYFLMTHHKQAKDFTEDDSLEVIRMSVKDRALVKFISKNLSDTVMFTIQEKCLNFVGGAVVNRSFNNLVNERKASFLNLFKENGTETQVKMRAPENTVPYNGFSYFKFDYPNGMDDKLRDAYDKMRELNNKGPRKKYLKQRKKST